MGTPSQKHTGKKADSYFPRGQGAKSNKVLRQVKVQLTSNLSIWGRTRSLCQRSGKQTPLLSEPTKKAKSKSVQTVHFQSGSRCLSCRSFIWSSGDSRARRSKRVRASLSAEDFLIPERRRNGRSRVTGGGMEKEGVREWRTTALQFAT